MADLNDRRFTARFAGSNETFRPEDVRCLNWRFVLTNDVDASPPTSPHVDSFVVTYRLKPMP